MLVIGWITANVPRIIWSGVAGRPFLLAFFATASAFLAVLFAFNLLSEFQRAIDPGLKSYKQPATLRFRALYLRGNPESKRKSFGPAYV